jgi:uncharacterized membrane protein
VLRELARAWKRRYVAAVSGATTNDAVTDASAGGAATQGDGPGPAENSQSVQSAWRIDAWRSLALSVLVLGLVCASICLCVLVFRLPAADRDAFLSSNTLSRIDRKRWLILTFGSALVPSAIACASIARWREAAVPWLQLTADRLCPFVLLFTVPLLLRPAVWATQPLSFLVLLLAVVMAAERLLERALSPDSEPALRSAAPESRLARIAPLAIVIAFACAYAGYMSYFTILRHHRLASAGFDLGIFDNLMVNALEGRPFYSSVAVPKGSYLSNHAEFGMFLFLPIYALHPAAETLLVLQSVFMGFAAVPLYFFAATRLSRIAAAALAVAYLFYAPLHGPNFFDFHWMPMSMFFFFWLFHALATRRRLTVIALSLVICSLREDAPFGLIATGLFLIATGFWARAGAWLTVLPSVWFVIVKFAIMPLAGPWWFSDIYKELFAPGETGYGSVVRTILVNPNFFLKTLMTEAKFTYALHLFAPLALLPLRNPALLLLALPGFIVTLMTTGYTPTTSISFQYTTHFIPFLFAAAAIALELRATHAGRAAARASLIALCFGVLCHSYVFGAILQRETFVGGFNKVQFTATPEERQRYRDLKKILANVPPRASIAATEPDVPHISNRPNAYSLKITTGRAEYLLVHRHRLNEESRRHIEETLPVQPYDLAAREGNYLLFRRGNPSKEGRGALRSLRVKLPEKTP